MKQANEIKIAIIGAGPSGLFMYKKLVETGSKKISIHIYEKKEEAGAGMPYSIDGANDEHITNVSDNEIPLLINSVEEWMAEYNKKVQRKFDVDPKEFHEYKVFPRLLFGNYLSDQFKLIHAGAALKNMKTFLHTHCEVTDVSLNKNGVTIHTANEMEIFDIAIIAIGHNWLVKEEKYIPGYFNSPYPPSKLQLHVNYPVAIRGSSLTAFDAVRTLSRQNGYFTEGDSGMLHYTLNKESENFKLVMHSLDGLLPAIRIHLDDSQLAKDNVITEEEIIANKDLNDGFVSLDHLFRLNFIQPIMEKDPALYALIKDLSPEEFVQKIMDLRERMDPFVLFKAEYAEAERSIRQQHPIFWKEMLASLSFALNYPAKHLSAEDMMRLNEWLKPLISIVIAFVPQSTARELIALYDAGVLSMISVDRYSKVIPHKEGGVIYEYTGEDGEIRKDFYRMFIDCIGQPALSIDDFPFKGLVNQNALAPATLKFRERKNAEKLLEDRRKDIEEINGEYYLQVAGIKINDSFQVVDGNDASNQKLYIMATPYIGGYNPDYSGLDFCNEASGRIKNAILKSYPL